MRAVFVELSHFAKRIGHYLTDDQFGLLQQLLLNNPIQGDIIGGTGGLRKLRFVDPRRGKGKRGGLRIIYFWWERGSQFWLISIYDKNEMNDLTESDCAELKSILKQQLEQRR